MKIKRFLLSARTGLLMAFGSILAFVTGCATPEVKAQWGEQALKEVRQYVDREDYSRADRKLRGSMWLFEGKQWGNLVPLCKVMNDCRKMLSKEEPDVEACQQLWAKKPTCPDFPWPMWFSDKDIEVAIASMTLQKGKFYRFKDPSGLYFVYTPVNEKEVAVVGWYKSTNGNGSGLITSVSVPGIIRGNTVVAIVGVEKSTQFGGKIHESLVEAVNNAAEGSWLFDFKRNFSNRALESLVIPEGVRVVTKGAFQFAKMLKAVTFPNSLERIEDKAFWGCADLAEAKFGQNLKSIGSEAFLACTKLSMIDIPDSVTEIGEESFGSCVTAKKIKIGKGIKSVPKSAFISSHGLKELEIAEGVEAIQQKAFFDSRMLPVVKLPKSLKTIGDSAFADNFSLVKVDLGGAEVIGEWAFAHTSLRHVNLPGAVKFVGGKAFLCSDLATINAAATATGIDKEAFKSTQWWSNAKGLIRIGDTVFGFAAERGAGPSAIIIPEGVRVIADWSGLGEAGSEHNGSANSLSDVELPQSLEIIGAGAFQHASIREIALPAKLKVIGQNAFLGCPIGEIEFPNGLAEIGGHAFAGCRIKSVKIPDTVLVLGEAAFEGNKEMSEVHLSKSLGKIEKNVFGGCVGLRKISIPVTVKEIESSAFQGCSKIEDVTMSADMITVPSLFAASSKSIRVISVQNGCESIIDGFAAALPTLQEVRIPLSVSSIGASAFLKCGALKSVVFEGKMPKASPSIFKGTPEDLIVSVKKDAGWQGDSFPANAGSNARKITMK